MKNDINDLKSFFLKIDYSWDDCCIDPSGGNSVLETNLADFDITPKDFLDYAYQDYEMGESRGLINALSNVKRAIECQSDIIHLSFGIPYKRLTFPDKVENLQKMGISPSVIFKNINAIRVELEHFYKKPEPQRVEDAIQIAHLFLDVTSLSLISFTNYYEVYRVNDENSHLETMVGMFPQKRLSNGIYFHYDDIKKIFKLYYYQDGIEGMKLFVTPKNLADYFKLINITVQIGKYLSATPNERVEKRILKDFMKRVSGVTTI